MFDLLDLSSIPRAREGALGASRRQNPLRDRGSMIVSLLWETFGALGWVLGALLLDFAI